MGRPRKWANDAERKRAARAKGLPEEFVARVEDSPTISEAEKDEIVDAVVPASALGGTDEEVAELAVISQGIEREQEVRERYGYAPSETRTEAERQKVAAKIMKSFGVSEPLTEEVYVARAVEATKAEMDAGHLKEVIYEGRTRLERCEAYARWCWHAFHAGEVASL